MKIFKCLILQMAVLSFFFCAPAEDEEAERICLPPELKIKNISDYVAKEVYMHDEFSYTGGEVVATGLASDSEVDVPVEEGDLKYFTYIRNLTTGSSMEIAITTAAPVEFNACYKYTLNLLSEDFFLDDFDNYTLARSDEFSEEDSGGQAE